MTKNSDLVLELISDPELIRFTHLENSEAWRSKLTKEQYADREWTIGCESSLGKRKESQDLGVFHYVLRDLSIKSENNHDNIVASCETMNRIAWRIDGKEGELTEVICACIGGVFTLPNHRKKGYAAEMINRLNDALDRQLGSKSFTFLYSEVGEYYSKFGYDSFEVPTHSIPTENVSSTKVPKAHYHFLKYDDYQKLVESQYLHVKQDLIQNACDTDKTLVTLAPDIDIFSWFHDRDIFISKILRPEIQLEHFGAVLNQTNDHIIWLHDWNEEKLVIVRIYNENEHDLEAFKKLINIALEEAQLYNFKEITLWDSSLGGKRHHDEAFEYIRELKGVKTLQPNSSVSAIRLHDKTQKGDYLWLNNDKWCWF